MLANLPTYLANARKAVINITGLLGSLLALGLLPEPYSTWGAAALAVLTAITHYLVPNADAPGTTPAVEELGAEDSSPVEEVPEEAVPASQVASDHQIAAPPSADLSKETTTTV